MMKYPRSTTRGAERVDESDVLRRYLNEIVATPLLTAAEEVQLAKRIEAGVHAAELLRRASVDDDSLPASRGELEAVARDGERAKEHMIRANLRLVVKVAKRHARVGMPLLDVIQEGNLGLIRAVEKFDYRKGCKFSTYAMWWIRQAIQRGMATQARTIRLPMHVLVDVAKLRRLDDLLAVRLAREPTAQEVAAESRMPVDRVVELRRLRSDVVSLDVPLGEDSDLRLMDLIENAEAAQAPDEAERHALAEALDSVLDTLPERQAEIVALRYGLHGVRPHTLQEIGDRLGLTHERVRQLEAEALGQLRTHGRRRRLQAWAA